MKLTPIAHPPAPLELPLFGCRVTAGFPSPADDYLEGALDLNEHLIPHPSATFFARAEGDSMRGRGIFPGDLLVVDRAIKPAHGMVVVASVNGELTCKVLDVQRRCLVAANRHYPPIYISDDCAFTVEGVVIASVRYQCPRN